MFLAMTRTPAGSASGGERLRLVGASATSDDAGLVAAVLAGQPAAAARLWDRFASLVRAVLRRTLGPSADAELDDLVQEVFIRVYGSLGNLRDVGALRGFVVGVAVNVASKQLRRWAVGRWLRLTETGALPDATAPAEDLDARAAVARFYRLLDRLGREDRLIFTLRMVQGLELTEVADAVGVSLATTKRRLARTTAKLHAAAARDPMLAGYLDGGAAHGG
jgi:RNA polymerase sigma-70 factor (ECF subfamily)